LLSFPEESASSFALALAFVFLLSFPEESASSFALALAFAFVFLLSFPEESASSFGGWPRSPGDTYSVEGAPGPSHLGTGDDR